MHSLALLLTFAFMNTHLNAHAPYKHFHTRPHAGSHAPTLINTLTVHASSYAHSH